MPVASADVVVVGAGLIGLAIAWRTAQRGLTVTVLDPRPGSGASAAAAGMLAPVTELHYGENALLTLNLASSARFGAWSAELLELTGRDIGYRRCGTVVAAWDAADLAALRDLEPAVAPGLPGGLLAAGDHQVDPVGLHTALHEAGTAAGVRWRRHRAVA